MPRVRHDGSVAPDIAIPPFLLRKPGEKPVRIDWSKMKTNIELVQAEARPAGSDVTRDQMLAEIAEEKRQASLRRIERMKAKQTERALIKDDDKVWDMHRCCWTSRSAVTARVRKKIATAAEDWAQLHGKSATDAGAIIESLTRKAIDMTAKKTVVKKKTKTAGTGSGRGVGIIDAIKEHMSRKEGATTEEIMSFLKKKFPDREPNIGTVRIQTNRNASSKDKVDGRGLVYFLKAK